MVGAWNLAAYRVASLDRETAPGMGQFVSCLASCQDQNHATRIMTHRFCAPFVKG